MQDNLRTFKTTSDLEKSLIVLTNNGKFLLGLAKDEGNLLTQEKLSEPSHLKHVCNEYLLITSIAFSNDFQCNLQRQSDEHQQLYLVRFVYRSQYTSQMTRGI